MILFFRISIKLYKHEWNRIHQILNHQGAVDTLLASVSAHRLLPPNRPSKPSAVNIETWLNNHITSLVGCECTCRGAKLSRRLGQVTRRLPGFLTLR
jgi:hypothetical protein